MNLSKYFHPVYEERSEQILTLVFMHVCERPQEAQEAFQNIKKPESEGDVSAKFRDIFEGLEILEGLQVERRL